MTSLAQSPGQNHDRINADQAFISPSVSGMARNDDNMVEITAVQKMVSAISGSLLTSLLVTPLDVVRVRWQSQSVLKPSLNWKSLTPELSKLALDKRGTLKQPSNLGVTACCREVFFMNNNASFCLAGPKLEGATSSMRSSSECAVEQVQKKAFTSTLDGMRKIAQNEGLTTLWRGLSPTLLMAIPANIIYFTGYDWLRYNKKSPIARATSDIYTPLIAGSSARILAAAAVSPIELFRTRMQATSGASATGHLVETFKGVEEMVKSQGYRSLWRGLTLTLWRDVPFSGIYWWGYESVRNKLTDIRERYRYLPLKIDNPAARAQMRLQSRENHMDTFVDSFTAGALSGAIASIVTMPFDVGKTRTQIHGNAAKPKSIAPLLPSAAPEERSMTRLLRHIFLTEGVAGLWRGWVPRILKVAPACAIMISSYEVGKRAFQSVNEKSQGTKNGGLDEPYD